MPKDRDDKLNHPQEDEFSLDAILAEFGSGPRPKVDDLPQVPYTPQDEEEDRRERQEEAFFFPPKPKTPPKAGRITDFPGAPPPPEEEDEEEEPGQPPFPQAPDADGEEPDEEEPYEEGDDGDAPAHDNVVELPTDRDDPGPLGLGRLLRKADRFAEHMFEDEGLEQARSVRKAEALIPGVDEEEAPPPVREKRVRPKAPPPPDTPPAQLAAQRSKSLRSLRLRSVLVFLLSLPMLALTLWDMIPPLARALPLPLSELLRCQILTGLHAGAMVLGWDILLEGLIRPFRGRIFMDTLCTLANLFTLADGVSLSLLPSASRLPFSAVSVLSLAFGMWGELQKRRGDLLSARVAASASRPYRVTRDENKWNNRDTYTKWSGEAAGFGSQLQDKDGAQRIYQYAAPLLVLACLIFSYLSTVGQGRQQDLLWAASACFTAASPLSAAVCFGLPWRKLALRLSKLGAALAGWTGVVNTTGSSNLLLTDIDLFPAGSVRLNSVRIFGDFPTERIISLTATVIRDSGCGLDRVFHDLLRSQDGFYRKGTQFSAHEGGGLSEVFGQDLVQVGSASFMALMDIPLPPGLNVKNAVFCAVNKELAGIFALNYQLPGAVLPSLEILIQNKITPVLCTRDFNLIPSVLRSRFKLPVEKMEFPPVERRRELSREEQEHSSVLTALLCREGLGPYAEAVVGARRLRSAVRLSAALACVGAAAGALLAFYLTFVGAYASLTPGNLLIFLLMWFIPAPLITGWVDRY